MTVDSLTSAGHARVPPDEVEAGDADAFAARLQALQERGGVQRQDIAIIRVVVRGQWFLSAETTAKEQAASLGANFLILEASLGGEEYAGSARVYRAVRLQQYGGLAVYTRPREAVEGKSRARPASPAPALRPLKRPALPPPPPPQAQDELGWVWLNQKFIVSHRLGVDLSAIDEASWRNLEHTVRARFPKSEHDKLTMCYRNGSKITVDLMQKKLSTAC